MTLAYWINIIALVAGPIIAVQLTRCLDARKEERSHRLWIFKTLMATRGELLAPAHVNALNMIDIEFRSGRVGDKPVIEAWTMYLDHLTTSGMAPEVWNPKRVDLLVDLLQKMSSALGFEFDKTRIKNSVYRPGLYGEIDDYAADFRRAVRGLIKGELFVPVGIVHTGPPPAGQAQP